MITDKIYFLTENRYVQFFKFKYRNTVDAELTQDAEAHITLDQ